MEVGWEGFVFQSVFFCLYYLRQKNSFLLVNQEISEIELKVDMKIKLNKYLFEEIFFGIFIIIENMISK